MDQCNDAALQYAQRMRNPDHDINVILERGEIQTDDENGAKKAILAATEAGCPNVVSNLLERGASMETKNYLRETIFQIAAKIPQTRKEEFEEYLEYMNRNNEYKPIETVRNRLHRGGIRKHFFSSNYKLFNLLPQPPSLQLLFS